MGLMLLLGVVGYSWVNRAEEQAAVTVAPTVPLPTFTPTSTATATPTETPFPTPTGTRVVASRIATGEPAAGGATIDPNATPTGTRVVVLGTSTGVAVITPSTPVPPTIPDSGGILPPIDKVYLLWAGGGVLFVLLLYGAYFRTKSPPQAPDE